MLRKICNYNKYIDKNREKMMRLVNDNQLPKEEKHRQMRKTIFFLIVIYKLMAQETIDLINELSDCKRSIEKLIAVKSLLHKSFSESIKDLTKERDDCKKHIDELNDFLINTGKIICTSLDLWQSLGASIEDLFNLCNAKPKQIQEVYRDHFESKKFSRIMMVYGLDYDHKGDWYDMRNHAPLTHSIKEYYIDFLEKAHVKYPEVREATDNKIQELFPALSEHVVTEKKDENGNIYYFNGDKPIALKEIALPLDDSLKEVIVNAIDAVVINGDKSNAERTDFVYSLMRNAGDIENIVNYFKDNDKNAIGEWLDVICPKSLSANEISEIMDACNYTKFD